MRWRRSKPGTKAASAPLTDDTDAMRGDVDFERLVQEQHAALYRFALSLARNENDACDLVQQTFYRWATKGHQLDDRSKIKSWLFTTLHREFLASQRRWIRFPHHELEQVQDELPETPPELPLHLDWEILADCLARMDPKFRAAVCLFYLEDHSYQDIASILEVPLGTVKSRISRGIAQLQHLLAQRTGASSRITPAAP